MQTRDFDLVLFGATGFTGGLVAEYLATHEAPVRWALAGRNLGKLEASRAELAARAPAAADLPLIVADALDPASVGPLAERTRVVCTTVGPYARYGLPLVEACARAGTHYCDLTGEPTFVRDTVLRLHGVARETGARIVHCCGFDSIPSDLGVLLLAEHFEARGARLAQAELTVLRSKGGVSGGTAQSLGGVTARLGEPEVRRYLADPYALAPESGRRGSDLAHLALPRRATLRGQVVAPFPMAGINTRVVHRSNALAGDRYGADFAYREGMSLGRGARGALAAVGLSLGMGAVVAATIFPPTRRLLEERLFPQPGEGPSRAQRESGYMRIEIDGLGSDGSRAVARLEGDLDPGYGLTAVMLAEAALTLADPASPGPGGVLTPAYALGDALVGRLRRAGLRLDVRAA